MSLLVWYPLNGDTYNRGTLGAELNPTASSVTYTTGITGQSLHTGSLNLTAVQMQAWMAPTVSIAMWIKVRSDGTFSNGTPFFSQPPNMNAPNNRKFSMFCYDGTAGESARKSLHCSWQHDGSGSTYWSCVKANFFDLDKWVHLCAVQDAEKGTITIYKNGVAIIENAVSGLSSMSFTGAAASTPLLTNLDYIDICDLRIYDHALSLAELKELSQALILHYTFDDVLTEGTTNLLNGNWPHTNFRELTLGAYGNFNNQLNGGTIEVVEFDGQRCLHIASKGGNNRCYRTLATSSGKTYTVSLDYYSSVANIGFNIERNGGDYSWKAQGMSYTTPGKWACLSTTFTNTSDTTLYIFLRCNTDTDAYINNIQVEEKDHPTYYTPDTRPTMLYNEAGFAQPVEKHNVSIVNDSGSGTSALDCKKTTWLKTNTSTGGQTNFTLAAWVNPRSYSGDCIIIGGCYLCVSDSGYLKTYCYGKSPAGYHIGSKTKIPTGQWTHIAVTWSDIHCIGYVNGVEEFKVACTGTSATGGNHDKKDVGSENSIGNRAFDGYIDDVRVYNTHLSAEDIYDLAHTKGYVTDYQDLIVNQLVEENISTNMATLNGWRQEGINDSGGASAGTMTNRLSTEFIPVLPSTSYYYAANSGINVRGVHYYDKDGKWISYYGPTKNSFTAETSANCAYVRWVIQYSSYSTDIPLANIATYGATMKPAQFSGTSPLGQETEANVNEKSQFLCTDICELHDMEIFQSGKATCREIIER